MKRIIILFTVTILLYGCGGSNMIEYPEASNTAKDGSFVSKTGIFRHGEKEYTADYGTITVPENRRKINSRFIHLPVIRIHARSNNPKEPIFQLSGGPGQTNMGCWAAIDSLLYDHDFIMAGYRGVDGSSILDCPEIKDVLSDNVDDFLSEESLKRIGGAWTACAERFDSDGIDLNGYTMTETIGDLEAVRKIFNYEKISLISGSYGTRLAYLYSIIHPDIINRSVMMASNRPGGFIWDPRRTDEQLKYYSRLWANDSVMVKKSPDLAATMKKVLDNMPRKWLLFSIDPGKVKMLTFCMLFERKNAALVFDAYVAAENGDYSGLALMSMAFDYILPDMFVWGEFAAIALSSDTKYWDEDLYAKPNTDKILGAPLNEFAWQSLKYANLEIEMIPDSLQVPANSDNETLFLSGSVDFASPLENARALLPYMKNAKQIVLSEAGHVNDIRYLQKQTTDALITKFINTGIIDTSEIKYIPMNFDAGWGFTGIAKAGVAAIGALALLLAGVVVWIL
ncbi:MAG: alpha/beta hydrolase [Ignavibacteriaceae bacterium]